MGYLIFRNRHLRISRWALAGLEAGSLLSSVSATAPRATLPSHHSTGHDAFVARHEINRQSMWKLEISRMNNQAPRTWCRAINISNEAIEYGYVSKNQVVKPGATGPSLVDHESASAALALGSFEDFLGSSKMTHKFGSLVIKGYSTSIHSW